MGKRRQEELVTKSVEKYREKKKWQLALRRYILEKKPSSFYASYFGLGVHDIRNWIEMQFTEGLNWDNFGKKWQFDHIVPVAYFDFSVEEDLLLCWNFINIRVEKSDLNRIRGNRVDVLGVRTYFEQLYKETGFYLCKKMLDKIESVEISSIDSSQPMYKFLISNRERFEKINSFTKDEFNRLNAGLTIEDIMLERDILRKYGQ
ncbi:MAG: hypothetical protein WAT19_04280 [Ferruginibacter sp.]